MDATQVVDVTTRQPAYEGDVARDLARRALLVAPVVVAALGLWRGVDGAASAAIALALVALNFLVSARLITWAAGHSPGAVYGAVFGGIVARLAALTAIVLGLRNLSVVDVPVLVLTIGIAHLSLLVWEAKHVGLTIAAPGLRPPRTKR